MFAKYNRRLYSTGLEQALKNITSQGITPNISTYNSIISSFSIIHETKECENTFSEIIKAGFKPNVSTYANMISAFSRTRNREKAMEYWSKFTENITQDNLAYNLLLRQFCANTDSDSIKEFLDRNLDVKLSFDTANTLIKVFADNGDVDNAERCFQKLKNFNVDPKESSYLYLLRMYAGLETEESREKCHELFAEMKSRGIMPTVLSYRVMMKLHEWDRNPKMLRSIFDEMLSANIKPTDLIMRMIIRSYGSEKNVEGIQAMLRKCEELEIPVSQHFHIHVGRTLQYAEAVAEAKAYAKKHNVKLAYQ